MSQIEKIVINDILRIHSAVSSDDGDQIFFLTKTAIQKGLIVEIDFSNISLVTTAFLNAAIGQLYSLFDSKILNEQIRFTNVTNEDSALIYSVIKRAKEYFANKKGFEDSADKSIYGS